MLRFWSRFAVLCGLALGSGLVSAPAAAAPTPQVLGIRLDVQGGTTRITLDLSQRAEYRLFFLNDPMRAVIDLPPVTWSVPSGAPAPRGLIASYRYGSFDPQTARLVVDLANPARVRASRYEFQANGRQRLVVEFEETSVAEFTAQVQPWTQSVTQTVNIVAGLTGQRTDSTPAAKSAGPKAPTAPRVAAATPTIAAIPSTARPPLRPTVAKRIVMLDPGHGGVDPGAIGIGGSFEKDVTLGMAREVRRQLEATGRYKVALTRDDDVFLRLRDRVAKARAADADLFISIHADSMRNHDTRGASVYTLSENASDDEAAGLAARENRSDIIAGVDLSRENKEVASILIDLAQRETMNHSVNFAGLLVGELGKDTQLVPIKPHRFAGFAVLRAADMPSTLIELGYLSNNADEQMLMRPAARAKVAAAIVRAIDLYFQKRPGPA